jgi:hypothetical protein
MQRFRKDVAEVLDTYGFTFSFTDDLFMPGAIDLHLMIIRFDRHRSPVTTLQYDVER